MGYEEFRLWFEEETGMSRDEILDMMDNEPWDEWPLVVKRLFLAIGMAAENVIWREE